jgi:transcription elongation GreA/GreB family factor
MKTIITKIFQRRRKAAPSQNAVDKHVASLKKSGIDLGDRILVNLNGDIITIQVVEDRFAELASEKVSMFTPLGSTLIGKGKEDEFEIILPQGKFIRCKVLEIL